MENKRDQVIVYGGTGYYGREVVRGLVNKGVSVKVLSRDSAKAQVTLGEDVEVIQGDVTDHQTIVESLRNVTAIIICLSAMSNKLIRKIKLIERDAVLAIMAEAKNQNISRLIYMSGYEMRAQLLNSQIRFQLDNFRRCTSI